MISTIPNKKNLIKKLTSSGDPDVTGSAEEKKKRRGR